MFLISTRHEELSYKHVNNYSVSLLSYIYSYNVPQKKKEKKKNIASKIKNIMSKMRLTLGLTEDGMKDVDNISINRKLTLCNMFL